MKRSLLFCCLLFTVAAYAQKTITGRVIDANTAAPLVNASVSCKGTRTGVHADAYGYFTLTVPAQCTVLIFSYLGYTTLEAPVPGNGMHMTVSLQHNVKTEDAVIVTGTISRPKRSLQAPAAATVSAGAVSQAPPAPVAQVLQGRAPGLAASSSGSVVVSGTASVYTPGAATAVQTNPAVVNNDQFKPIYENRFTNTACQPVSTFAADVDKASYSYLRRSIMAHSQVSIGAVKVEELINYFDYNYAPPAGKAPYTIHTELTQCPWNTRHQLMRVALQGRRNPVTAGPGANFVFLIDVSGSMEGYDRLDLVKQSFRLLMDSLQPNDKISIVTYAGSPGLVLDATAARDTAAILNALQRLQAGGSTAGGAGIALAYATARKYFVQGGNNRVILATDGDFNVGASSEADLLQLIEKERESGVFLTCLGFGTNNYKDVTMELLADKGNGNYFYIDQLSEAQRVLQKDFHGTMNTIAKDVKIQVEFNSRFVQGYRLIGYENRLLAKEDFTNDVKDAGEIGEGHTVTVLYEVVPAGIVDTLLDKAPDSNRCENGLFTAESNTLAAVRTRYKLPDGRKSQPLDFFVLSNPVPFTAASANTRWAASVAMFGMLVRNSPFKGTATTQSVIETATKVLQPGNAVQQEFVQLASMYRK